MTLAARPLWPSILLVGPTGSGKTPLGEEMERRGFMGRRCVHFDFGRNLRAASEGGGEYGLTGPELERVRASLRSGALFEDRDLPMIIKVLRTFVESRGLAPDALLVLNGLPRHRSQAEALSSVLAVERVVALVADADVIRERIRLDTGKDRAGRADDDLRAIAGRLEIFRERTEPLIGLYRGRGVPVTALRVSATMTAAEALDGIERAIAAEKSQGV